jgi:hypothetical protein
MTQGNIAFATLLYEFTVSYIVPACLAHPTATVNNDSSVTLDVGSVVAITGTTSGTVAYEPDYLYTGNIGLNMDSGAYVQFALNFLPPFTKEWIVTPAIGFTGAFNIIRDTASTYYISIGYDGTRFYLDINGDLYYDTAEVLTGNPYIIGIMHDGVNVRIRHKEVV